MNAYALLSSPLPLVTPRDLTPPPSWDGLVETAFGTAAAKLSRLTSEHPDVFPLYTTDGAWDVTGDAWTNWCEGFLAGQLWLLAGRGAAGFRELAEHYSTLLEPRQFDRSVHDLGFLFWPTYRRWYEHTGDAALDGVVVQAGKTLALRYHESGRYLRSFLSADSCFIDIMMNVGVIFYAAMRTGDSALARVAVEHCLTTRRHLVRGDGSTAHEGIFDLTTGAFLRQTTQQGWRDDSSWARGQAWSLYGFGTAYRYTGDRRFLDTARACADFYLAATADEIIPPNDWSEPSPAHRWESSAAAVAAGGLWQLAGLEQDPVRAHRYGTHSLATLTRLCQTDFLASDDQAWQGVLKHGTYHEGRGLGVDESTMWGDYWFLDALETVDRSLSGRT